MKNRYKVYDTVEDAWLPGEYDCKGLREKLGVASNFSKYAETKCLLNRRYRIVVAGNVEVSDTSKRFPPSLLNEWDRVREMILRGYK